MDVSRKTTVCRRLSRTAEPHQVAKTHFSELVDAPTKGNDNGSVFPGIAEKPKLRPSSTVPKRSISTINSTLYHYTMTKKGLLPQNALMPISLSRRVYTIATNYNTTVRPQITRNSAVSNGMVRACYLRRHPIQNGGLHKKKPGNCCREAVDIVPRKRERGGYDRQKSIEVQQKLCSIPSLCCFR